MAASIVIDAGHGGYDSGASYQGRREKDDVLRLALAVGQKLAQDGYQVYYTRTEDVYDSPYEKAQIANAAGADYFVSLHRNSSPNPNTYSGVETLVYQENQVVNDIADAVNQRLSEVGFRNLGIKERPGLVVLRRTQMPAVLIEAGFLNTDADNALFDQKFNEIADAIAQGIEEGIGAADTSRPARYGVQVGLFSHAANALFLQEQLEELGYQVQIRREEPYDAVIVGEETSLEDAAALQNRLRQMGYDTLIVSL
ncbi:MAG: N-acetylmuramoyl-L-alanine amidase [Lachnospiraceae bacterium]|nr:N-acetylmuramoyl-L-alanine amidase [Lachnospiraceae bacterium]MCI9149701.1 N-acetylmuramoyl-L-alanine amidase [Lachnospiraceae bacterium]